MSYWEKKYDKKLNNQHKNMKQVSNFLLLNSSDNSQVLNPKSASTIYIMYQSMIML